MYLYKRYQTIKSIFYFTTTKKARRDFFKLNIETKYKKRGRKSFQPPGPLRDIDEGLED